MAGEGYCVLCWTERHMKTPAVYEGLCLACNKAEGVEVLSQDPTHQPARPIETGGGHHHE